MSKLSKLLNRALADTDKDGIPDIIAKLLPAVQLLMGLYALRQQGHNVSEHIALVSAEVGMPLHKDDVKKLQDDAAAFDTEHPPEPPEPPPEI